MEPDFQAAIKLLLELEGGYVNHESDPGGATRYGISQRSYPNLDIENLTKAQAISIYRRDYWEPVAKRVTDPAMRIMIFDSAVNHGLNRALSWLETYKTLPEYTSNRLRFYAGLETFGTFGREWTRRVASVLEAISRLEWQGKARRRVEALIDNRGAFTRLVAAVRGISGPVVYNVRPMTSREGLKIDLDSA